MRVLLIHQHFSHPEEGGAIRSYSLARFLVNAGHEVDVVTRKNGINSIVRQDLEGIKVHYLPITYSNEMNFLSRIPAYLKFVFLAVRYFRKIHKNTYGINYCISTPLTSGLIGLWLKRKYKLPFIFEVGDLWPDAPIAIKAVWFPPTKYFLRKLEKHIYKKASAVIGLSPPIVETIKTRTRTFVHYVPNFSDNDFFQPIVKKGEPIIISYIGTLGRANELEYMLDVASASHEKGLNVKFNIMGSGARKDALVSYTEKLGLTNVKFHAFGNKKAVKQLLDKTDAVYVSYKNLKILETGSPNKFFDGLAAGKLMILNFGGWLGDYVKENKCGFSYDPEKPEKFIEQLKPFIDNTQLLREAQANARTLAEELFALNDWEVRFVRYVESAVTDSKS